MAQPASSSAPIDQYLFSEIVSKKLTRQNWLAWRVSFFFLLKNTPGAEQILLSDEPNNDSRLDHQLGVALLSCVETDGLDSLYHIVMEELKAGRSSAREIFKALEAELAAVEEETQNTLHYRLDWLQLHGDDVSTVINEMDKIWLQARLSNMKGYFTDDMKRHVLDTKCRDHPQYSATISNISTHFAAMGRSHRDTIKRVELRLRMSQEEIEKRSERERDAPRRPGRAAAHSGRPAPTHSVPQTSAGSCDNCGRRNHVTSQCRARPNRAQ